MRYISLVLILAVPAAAADKPIAEDWDYAASMKKVAAAFKGRPGVVLHIGDSITYSNPYGQWARSGAGKTDDDKAALKWMHAGADNDSDGWYLARFDHADGGRSYTACSGIRLDEMLAGGKQKMPSLEKLLDTYKPQAVVFMLGSNDASARRETADFRKQYLIAIDLMTSRGIVPIVSTIPPHINQPRVARFYNDEIREIAKDKGLPLIDYEKEILTRRPDDWNGTLLNKNDVHPTSEFGGSKATSEPTAANLKNSGYLLRGWLSVMKIGEVKAKVFDGIEVKKEGAKPGAKPQAAPPGKPVKVPITRDTWLSNVGEEVNGTNGGSARLKFKSYQEMSLFDIDATPLKGHVVTGGTLHVRLAGPERLLRMTIGTVGAEWVEGKGAGYAKEAGAFDVCSSHPSERAVDHRRKRPLFRDFRPGRHDLGQRRRQRPGRQWLASHSDRSARVAPAWRASATDSFCSTTPVPSGRERARSSRFTTFPIGTSIAASLEPATRRF